MKIAIILGTRPEIIKMSPIIRYCQENGVEFFILHSGQHYDYEMDQAFFEDLKLPSPDYNLSAGAEPYRMQVGLLVRNIMDVLAKERPDVALVQGDTNTVLAGALAANKLRVPVAHHEAGLRSHDLTMLEETNRIITDHIADFLFSPTTDAHKNLTDEGIDESKIFQTGNTVVDAIKQNLAISNERNDVCAQLGVEKGAYILATAHRAENVDNEKRLRGILKGMGMVGEQMKMPIIYPVHPRTAHKIDQFVVTVPDGVRLVKPVGYLDFLQLEARAKLIMTDSGGIQEEACIMGVPCVTMRDNTERPETIAAGVNVLAGANADKIAQAAQDILNAWDKRRDAQPFGDGTAGEQIIKILQGEIGSN